MTTTVLKTLRTLRGQTIIEASRLARVNPATFSLFENGTYTIAERPKSLAKIMRLYRLPAEVLLAEATPNRLVSALFKTR